MNAAGEPGAAGPEVRVRRLHPERDADLPLPRYMSPGAAGMDVCAAVAGETVLAPGEIRLVPTGLAAALPPGYELQVRPRSGLAVRHGIGIVNAPGTIDADYRGEIRIGLINFGPHPFRLNRGDRIAQLVLNRVYRARLREVRQLEATDRNDGGFGHTGR